MGSEADASPNVQKDDVRRRARENGVLQIDAEFAKYGFLLDRNGVTNPEFKNIVQTLNNYIPLDKTMYTIPVKVFPGDYGMTPVEAKLATKAAG
eukprot:15095662-Heterocapsa_arctica.AAC.1